MKRLAGRVFPLSLAVVLLLLSRVASASPLVYLQLLARPDGTTQAFSSTITATAVGEEFDWIVVATLAPAGTTNANLPVDSNGKQQIGSWQYNQNTGVSDGLGGVSYALYESYTATTQVSFQNGGFLGATATGAHMGIDPSISNGLTASLVNAGNFGNASYSGGVNTGTYTYPSQTGTQTPTGISQSPTGNAMWQNFAAAAGVNGGSVVARAGDDPNNDLVNMTAIAGSNAYVGVDDGTVDTSGTSQTPTTVILESGSHNYYNTFPGSGTKVDSTFAVTSVGLGTSTLNINVYDMNPGNPGGAYSSTGAFLNIQYHDTAGAVRKPGQSGSLMYAAQTGSDPVVQFTGLTIIYDQTLPSFVWTNSAATGSWNNAGNWSPPGGPPNAAGLTIAFAATSPIGTVTLDGNQTAGTLQFNNGSAGSGMTINAGSPAGTLTFDDGSGGNIAGISVIAGQHIIARAVLVNQPLSVDISTTTSGTGLTIGGAISNGPSGLGNSIFVSGGGTLTLSNPANTFAGTTTISNAQLALTGNLAAGNSVAVDTGGSLSGSGAIAGPVSMNGGAALSGSGTLTLQSTLAVSGSGNTISSGKISVAGGTTISGGSSLTINGTLVGSLSVPFGAAFSGSGTIQGSVNFTGNSATGSTVDTFNGAIADGAGVGSLTINALGSQSAGILTLAAPSTYSGATTINSGYLEAGCADAIPQDSAVVMANGTAILTNGFSQSIGSLTGSGAIENDSNKTGVNITLTIGNDNTSPPPFFGSLVDAIIGALSLAKVGTGTLTLAGPSFFFGSTTVDAGTLVVTGSGNLQYTSGASIQGQGVLDLASTNSALKNSINVVNNSTSTFGLHVSSGNQVVARVVGTGATVVELGASLTAYQILQNSLTINGTGIVTLAPSGSGSISNSEGPNNINYCSFVTTLLIGGSLNGWTGTLDIGNNGLVIAYGSGPDPYSTIDNMIESGYNGGAWTGTGITSSLAAAAVTLGSKVPALNIGLVDFTPGAGNYTNSTFIVFEGQTISTDAVLVRLTYMDDLVLAGDTLGSDATDDALMFAANVGSGTTWSVGDLVHNGGPVNSSDALLFAANYVVGLPSLDGTTGGDVSLGSGEAAVPEPSSAVLAVLSALGLGLAAAKRQRPIACTAAPPPML